MILSYTSSVNLTHLTCLNSTEGADMGNGSTTTAPAARRPGSAQRWFFTMHALQRMDERGVLRSEVLTALDEPEVEYPAHAGRRMAERGGLAVVRADDVVVTV